MSTTTVAVPALPLFDQAHLAVAGFLARYSGPTRTAYTTDLRQSFDWCADRGLDVLGARRGHLELWPRSMEERGLARATAGRRLSTVSDFYRFAVVDGLLAHSPAEFVRRPKISTESDSGWLRVELAAERYRAVEARHFRRLERRLSVAGGRTTAKPCQVTPRQSPRPDRRNRSIGNLKTPKPKDVRASAGT